MLNRSDENSYPFLVSVHRGKFQLFTVEYDVNYRLFIHGFYYVM